MTEKFKVGQRVIAVEDAKNLHIGDKGTMLGTYDDGMVNIKLDNDYVQHPWYPCRFQALDEYPMDYTTAFKVLIDGKMVEDKQGCVLRFSKVDMRFQCKTNTGKFINVDTVPNDVKFKEYVVTPKFKRGDFVTTGHPKCNVYCRVFKVYPMANGEYCYGITEFPDTYEYSDGNMVANESELTEVVL